VLTGYSEGAIDLGAGAIGSLPRNYFVAEFDGAGVHWWSEPLGPRAYEGYNFAAATPSGEVAIAGCYDGEASRGAGLLTNPAGDDIYLAKLATDCPPDLTMGAGARQRFTVNFHNSRDATIGAYYFITGDPELGFETPDLPHGFTQNLFGSLSLDPHATVNIPVWVQVASSATPGNTLQFSILHSENGESPDTCAVAVHVDPQVTGVDGATPPGLVATLTSMPNPFSSNTTLNYFLPRGAYGESLAVYDTAGRLVRVLERGALRPGDSMTVWDGTDSGLARVPSGIYFCVLRGRGFVVTTKTVLLR